MADRPRCYCLIAHPVTEEDRNALNEALDYARSIGDEQGILLAVARLTTAGSCPARREEQQP